MVAWLLMVTLPSSLKMLPPKAHSQGMKSPAQVASLVDRP